MSLIFQCPSCQAAQAVGEQLAGRQMRCANCGQVLIVPASEPTAPGSAAPGRAADEIQEGEEDEGPGFGDKPPMQQPEMDMTPMVDVTFQLLIFFMVTAAFAMQKSIEIPKPQQDEPQSVQQKDPETDPAYIIVKIDENNTYQVLYDTIAPEDAEAGSEQELLQKLRYARDSAPGGTPPSKLLVQAHGDAHHEYVVTALDAGTEVGMEQVQLMTVEEMD